MGHRRESRPEPHRNLRPEFERLVDAVGATGPQRAAYLEFCRELYRLASCPSPGGRAGAIAEAERVWLARGLDVRRLNRLATPVAVMAEGWNTEVFDG